ncbi:MAG: hypothetical protein ACO2PP_07060 [Thermocrinis sp.]|uniref:hypothetical protein n=1 Tax=Thermocrinis sp. TaxID=2024383 RepID=UPI003C104A96
MLSELLTRQTDTATSKCLASSKNYTIRPETERLKKLGARLLYCAHSAHQRA